MLSRKALHVVSSLCRTSPDVARNLSTLSKLTLNRNFRLRNAKLLASLQKLNHSLESSFNGSGVRYKSTNIVTSPYEDVPIPDALLHEFVWENYEKWADKIAIECGLTGRSYTFSKLRELCKKFAAALLKSGLKPGEVVAIILPNTPDYPIAALGAIEAGLTVSTVNPAYTPEEIAHQFRNSKSVCAITFTDKLDEVLKAKANLESDGGSPISVISINDFLGAAQPLPSGVWSFREMVENNLDTTGIESVCRKHNITQQNLVALPYSSGTTGLPKGVCLSHFNLVVNLQQMAAKETEHILEPEGNVHQDVLPAILPFFHIYGFVIIMMSSLRHGGKLVTLPRFEPNSFIKVLETQKSTIMYIVPPIMLFMTAHPAVTKKQLEHMRFLASGAAPIGASDVTRTLHKMPESCIFMQAYGLTETSPVCLLPRNNNRNLSTVGSPTSITKAKIIDTSTGKILGPNEHGELCIYGPQVMQGYLNNQKATDETIINGWLHTGDIGYYDDEGLFYIVDRLKELIKVKGFQVAPAELEELLRTHPKVNDVAVIGVPDARSGEVPLAYVIRKDDVTEDELKGYISDRVAPFKQLAGIVFTDSIPKSPSGKILRRFLKDAYLKEHKK
ncbi:4-coumarate--CoA ligase 1 isoform X3 [Nilaparvata lugens]|uniref:4-coumarate--CoA ligase 1 isoform X3 n=1 Tax=Nilaparvata lugens TaxID=108931 RepID=UPI00193DDB93|nr:4-coumarate--CoA ligase 1 isoform X3 [Nilaparvata lugens]XP_039293593.1 4-coumarate--CoA ligase 1 isoform X3 [Nilaparvata lugens]